MRISSPRTVPSMNASAYLTSHGWLGTGNSLHPSGRGLKKPLTVSKKPNKYGVGKKKVDVHADQWWSRTFDSALKELTLRVSQPLSDTTREESPTRSSKMVNTGYETQNSPLSGFVKGEGLQGTIPTSPSRTMVFTPVEHGAEQGLEQNSLFWYHEGKSVPQHSTMSESSIFSQGDKAPGSRGYSNVKKSCPGAKSAHLVNEEEAELSVGNQNVQIELSGGQIKSSLVHLHGSSMFQQGESSQRSHRHGIKVTSSRAASVPEYITHKASKKTMKKVTKKGRRRKRREKQHLENSPTPLTDTL